MVDSKKIESFEQLIVWQESQELAVDIYILTKKFPPDELFAITNQLRRSASSISANIAEGFGRKTHKDKLHFYTMAYGSLLEAKNFLYLSNKLSYLTTLELDKILQRCATCQKLINGSKRSLSQ